MRIEQTFEVPQSLELVWDFFHEQVERVVRCVPGVQEFDDLGDDEYRVTMTQKVGSVFATFDLNAKLEEEEDRRFVVFSANGRTVRGAAGTLQSLNRVEFASTDDGGTRMVVISDLTVGGMMGSMGHRAIEPKARQVTEQFTAAISDEMADDEARPGAGS